MAGGPSETTGSPRTVFRLEERGFSVDDVIDAAEFRGEVREVRNRLRRGLEMEEDNEALQADGQTLQEMADRFRYERDLISAEETETWLEERNLTLEGLTRYLARLHLAKADRGTGLPGAPAPSEPHGFIARNTAWGSPPREALRAELWLSGEMDEMARALAWRVVALLDSQESTAPPPAVGDLERASFLQRCGLSEAEVPAWLAALARDSSWLDEMLRMERAYQHACEDLLTPERLARELASLKMSLTTFEFEVIDLDTLDAAREAYSCVRRDGLSMEEVARQGGYPYDRWEAVHEDLSEELRRIFLSANLGEVLAPIPAGEAYQLCRILEKREPDLRDEEVHRKVERRILESWFSDRVARHIHWAIVPAGGA